ncbi:MAG: hypothetical protein ACAH88_14075 [Roseimicrobium sp.]
MKLASFIGLAVALAALVGTLRPGLAAEPRYVPVDVFAQPAQPPGTAAAILPPGTYYAVQPDGVRLSGIIHAPGISGYAMLSRPQPAPSPRTHVLQHNPGLRFVPVDPQLQGITQARPSR